MFEIISKKLQEGKSGLKTLENELFVGSVVVLVGLLGFGAGKYGDMSTGPVKTPIVVRQGQGRELIPPQVAAVAQAKPTPEESALAATVVASKNGKRYYYAWCSGASRLSAKTKITFKTKDAAEKAGYTIASGCSADKK